MDEDFTRQQIKIHFQKKRGGGESNIRALCAHREFEQIAQVLYILLCGHVCLHDKHDDAQELASFAGRLDKQRTLTCGT